ncbi:histidine phosphatase family protein [Spirosoma foliorum]|uniref:Histidine phosphatase family protein n=1 Tax=Spirosoma foliorum TaxID=2710596 RepID=A0A7G5GVN0_9BACT|nr:histidine phosphatase family protein [Spirosoma foliorum]QMW02922.1 histidine phosphatase family protein [Spirosoma foliorum]
MRYFTLFIFLIVISSACSTTTVYIVRHGEKVNETDTTNLSPAGYARAAALAERLGNQPIDSIFSTPYRRTRQTVQPLAQRLGVPVIDYPAKPTEAIVNRVGTSKGKTVLVVGHSNTILEIARGLGAQPTMTRIESGDFDNLLQVRLHRGLFRKSVTFSQTTYGQMTPP